MSYRKSARWYDTIYSFKDYAAEAESLRALLADLCPDARRLLDVACGTGEHLRHLQAHFEVEGIDASPDMLAVAREKLPGVPLHQADMRTLDLGRTFDAAICLFSAVGHLADEAELDSAMRRIARHLDPGGVFLLEPWLAPEAYTPGGVHSLFVNKPDVKLARINVSQLSGRTSVFDMHHLVGTPEGVEHFVEHLELTLFPLDSYREAMAAAGLSVRFDPGGPSGRGLFIGVLPASPA
jgi:ubiquinone/menaquinone biosynthesis C-methylase UbiE